MLHIQIFRQTLTGKMNQNGKQMLKAKSGRRIVL